MKPEDKAQINRLIRASVNYGISSVCDKHNLTITKKERHEIISEWCRLLKLNGKIK